jgi:hypothetical protein
VTGLRSAAAALAAAALLVSTLGACGGTSEAQKEREAKAKEGFSAAADLNTCSKDAKAASKPYGSSFPKQWPFPQQSVVFNAEDRAGAGTIVSAVSSAPFKDVLAFMNKDVVAAGFAIKDGETEAHDAEAEWAGNGFHGRWAIRESASCHGDTVIQVLSASD